MDKPTIDFYNKNAEAQSALYEKANMSDMYRRLVSLVPPYSRILEIGCGSGRDARALVRMGFSVMATDASLGMICEAERRSKGCSGQLQFSCMAFPLYDNHPLFAERFDLVLAVAVLMHFSEQDIEKTLSQVAQLLNPGGIFFCTFKNQPSLDSRLYQTIDVSRLIADCAKNGLINFLQESNDDLLGRATTWTTLAFKMSSKL